MKIFFLLLFFGTSVSYANEMVLSGSLSGSKKADIVLSKSKCLEGSFTFCKIVFDNYASTSDRKDAPSFFSKACALGELNVTCTISTERNDGSTDSLVTFLKTYNPKKDTRFTIPKGEYFKVYKMSVK